MPSGESIGGRMPGRAFPLDTTTDTDHDETETTKLDAKTTLKAQQSLKIVWDASRPSPSLHHLPFLLSLSNPFLLFPLPEGTNFVLHH